MFISVSKMSARTITLSSQKLIAFQSAISELANEFKEGNIISVRRLEDKVINVIHAFGNLKPESSLNTTDAFIVNYNKLFALQTSLSDLSEYFVKGRYIDIDTALIFVNRAVNSWNIIGRT